MEYDNEFEEDDRDTIFFYIENSNIDGVENRFILRVRGNNYLDGIDIGTEEERSMNDDLVIRLERMNQDLVEIFERKGFEGIDIIFEDKNGCKSIRAWLAYFLLEASCLRLFANASYTFHANINILECNNPAHSPCYLIDPVDILQTGLIVFDDRKDYMIFDQNGWIDVYKLGDDNVSKLVRVIGNGDDE